MRLSLAALAPVALLLSTLASALPAELDERGNEKHDKGHGDKDHGHGGNDHGHGCGGHCAGDKDVIAPKVFLVSMFDPEDVWTTRINLTRNITLPGLSQRYPDVHCNEEGSICQIITGEGEINAAVTMSSLLISERFKLTQTYFLVGGIAGVNPYMGTLGTVGLARYAVQVALAYELDARQIPSNWTTGYWLKDSTGPGQPAGDIYGTEVFELNTNLRDSVRSYLDGIKLNDSSTAAAYRLKYDYAPANQPPTVIYGDVSTSDVYFAGTLLSEAFGNITKIWTNGTGEYAFTAQEDNASFEAMIRMHKAGRMDFSRVILMRTAADFDRAPPNVGAYEAFVAPQGGFLPSIENIFIAGKPIVDNIIKEWDSKYAKGVEPQAGWRHNADILHTLEEGGGRAHRRRSLRSLRG